MSIDKIIQSRRSVREFSDKKPDWRDIIDALDAVRYAPMAGNAFTLKFIVVNDKKKIKAIAEAAQQDFIAKAHYIVVVCTQKRLAKTSFGERSEVYLRQQAGAAIENFLLALEEKGLAACWIGHVFYEMVKPLLKIKKEDIQIEAIIPIGYEQKKKLGKPKPVKKIDLDNILYFNTWENRKMEKEQLEKY